MLLFTQSVEFFFASLRDSFKEAAQSIKNSNQKPSPGASLQFQLMRIVSHHTYYVMCYGFMGIYL